MTNWNDTYKKALSEVYYHGNDAYNDRTGTMVKKKFGYNILLKNISYIPTLTLRKMHIKTAAAELAWTLSGEKSTEWLNKYTSIWKKFEKPAGIIEAAYGHRWMHHYKRDQIKGLINMLKNDPTSRQGVVIAWDCASDGLDSPLKTNIPCPFAFVCVVHGNKLNMHVTQRSSDIILGLPYDMMMYSLLLHALAASIDIRPGSIMFSITDLHLYTNFQQQAASMLDIYWEDFKKPFKSFSVEEIQADKDKYIDHCINYFKDYKHSGFTPKFEIIL